MFNRTALKPILLAAAICASNFVAASAHADYHFDFSQSGSLGSYAGVSFANAVTEDIVDANFNVTGQHWVVDAGAPAVTLEAMSSHGYNGTAAVGVTGLQALWQPVLMQFGAPLSIASFQLKQDDSTYGFTGTVSMSFLDANGQQVGSSVDYVQNAVSTITSGPLSDSISAVLLTSGKFYTGIDVITAVPEPETYAMMLAGLALVGLSARRVRRRSL